MEIKDLIEIVENFKLARKEVKFMRLTDDEACKVDLLYPRWEDYIGKSLAIGDRVRYRNMLYKVNQPIPIVEEYKSPSTRNDLYVCVSSNDQVTPIDRMGSVSGPDSSGGGSV